MVGEFTVMNYYTNWPIPAGCIAMECLTVYAKDGRLVQAGASGCTWGKNFFRMSPEDEAELNRAYDDLWREFRFREELVKGMFAKARQLVRVCGGFIN